MQRYVSPTDPLVAELVDRLDPDQREAFEERAGIVQFDAGLPRDLMPKHWPCLMCSAATRPYCPASLSWRLNWMAAPNGC